MIANQTRDNSGTKTLPHYGVRPPDMALLHRLQLAAWTRTSVSTHKSLQNLLAADTLLDSPEKHWQTQPESTLRTAPQVISQDRMRLSRTSDNLHNPWGLITLSHPTLSGLYFKALKSRTWPLKAPCTHHLTSKRMTAFAASTKSPCRTCTNPASSRHSSGQMH